MQEELIYKLRALQSIEPDEVWQMEKKSQLMEQMAAFGVDGDIYLSSKDIYARKEKFSLWHMMPNRMALAMTSIVILLTSGVLTVSASQSSLPGDTLYSVKKASEQVALAVASANDKPKIEIEQAGKRLEELALISQKSSDSSQHQKVEQLVNDYREKVNSATEHLAQLSENGKADGSVQVASVARVVTEQSEKYTEVLRKTTDSLPQTVKDKVAVQVADAKKETEKTNIAALMVMVDTNTGAISDEDIAAKVQKTVEKAEVKLSDITEKATTAAATSTVTMTTNGTEASGGKCASTSTDEKTPEMKSAEAENVAITTEAMKELEKAKENLKNNNLMDTLKSVAAVSEITDKVTDTDATTAQSAPVNPVQVETTLPDGGQTATSSGK